MISYNEKANIIKYNMEKITKTGNLIYRTLSLYSEELNKNVVLEIKSSLKEILEEAELEECVIEKVRKETEDEAREYFGNEFIEKFEEIKKRCDEEDIVMQIHGTFVENAEKIQSEGLWCEQNVVMSTACGWDGYSDLLNWPHKHYKGLVMLGQPKRSCAPV